MGSSDSAGSAIDLQPLLDTLSKVSRNRVLPHHELVKEDKLHMVKIPVRAQNASDKTDKALRRYAADWIKTNMKDTSVDTRFEPAKNISWYDDTTKEETPLYGLIVISWWPRPPLTEFEQLMAMQRAKKKEAESS